MSTKLIISTHQDDSATIEPVHLDPGFKVRRIDNSQREPVLHLAIHALEAERDENGFFRVEGMFAVSGSSERRVIVLGASGRLEPWIRAYPPTVNLGKVESGKTYNRSVRFISRAKGLPIVHAVHPEYVSVHVEGQEVTLEVTAPEAPKLFRTGVLLRVGEESANIPIVGLLDEESREPAATPPRSL